MVIVKIATEVVKRGVTYGSRFARSDKVAWNKLYTGFPKYVKKGTREGFLVGSTIGGLISGSNLNDDGTPSDSAVPKKFRKKTSKFNKTYNRFRRSPYRSRCKSNAYCDCRRKR